MIQLRCSCGEVFHADDQHAGRQLKCRCGRVLAVRRTPNVPRGAPLLSHSALRGRGWWPGWRRRPPHGTGSSRGQHDRGRVARARWTAWLSWSYLAAAVIAWLVLWLLSDRWWPATVFLFGPRWILLLPLVFLVPAAALFNRRMLAPLAGAAAIVLIPVVGMRVGWSPWRSGYDPGTDLRIVSFNTAAREGAGRDLELLLDDWRPDLVALQECGPHFLEGLRLAGWHQHHAGQLCLLSRHPILEARSMDQSHFEVVREHGLGGTSAATRYLIDTPRGRVHLANVHLETARRGLEGLFDSDPGRVTRNAEMREIESRQVRRWLDAANGPLIVAGDFNMPVESVIYRRSWGTFENAFSSAGIGLGATRDNGWIQVRIDHILMSEPWRTRRAFVGPDVESDHRPLVADLRWRGRD